MLICDQLRLLTLPVPILDEEKKIKLNFYFHTACCSALKGFMKALKGFLKPFWGTTKKCENKNLIKFLFQYNFQKCTGQEELG